MQNSFENSVDALARHGRMVRKRHGSVDALRGLAVVAMIVFHAIWTGSHFGFLPADALDGAAGRWSARIITAVFLFVTGLSLVLAHESGLDRRRFFRRVLIIGFAAVFVSVATFYALPASPIYFGVLHCIAVSSLLALLFLRLRLWVVLLVAVLLFAALEVRNWNLVLDPAFLWLGLSREVPVMADYVPLVPWFALVLIGIAAARVAVLRPWLLFPVPKSVSPLQVVGRYALPIYLLHQPLLFGIAFAAGHLGFSPQPSDFVSECRMSCEAQAGNRTACAKVCACAEKDMHLNGVDLAQALHSDTVKAQAAMIVTRCSAIMDP
jgi:uncharacterized membrane protein